MNESGGLRDITHIRIEPNTSVTPEYLTEVARNYPNMIITSDDHIDGFDGYTNQIKVFRETRFFRIYNHNEIEYIQFEKEVDYIDFYFINLFQEIRRITLDSFEFILPYIVPREIEDVSIMGESFFDLPELINFKFVKTLHLQNLPIELKSCEWSSFEEFFQGLDILSELSLAGPLRVHYDRMLTWIPSKNIRSVKLDCLMIDDQTIHRLADHESIEIIVLPSLLRVEYVRNYLNSLMKEGKFRNLSHVCLQTNFYIVKKSKLHRSKKELS